MQSPERPEFTFQTRVMAETWLKLGFLRSEDSLRACAFHRSGEKQLFVSVCINICYSRRGCKILSEFQAKGFPTFNQCRPTLASLRRLHFSEA